MADEADLAQAEEQRRLAAALTQVSLGSHFVAAHSECRRFRMGCGEPLTAQRLHAHHLLPTGVRPGHEGLKLTVHTLGQKLNG